MKKSSSLQLLPQFSGVLGNFWMFLLAAYWLFALLGRAEKSSNAFVTVWIIATAISLSLSSMLWAYTLKNGAVVFSANPIPRPLWRNWLRSSLRASSLRWAFAVITGTLLLSLKNDFWNWGAAAALFSLAACLSTIVVLSNSGLLHWLWAWLIAACLAILSVYAGFHGFETWMRLPFYWHLPLALCWPLLVLMLVRHWEEQAPNATESRSFTLILFRQVFSYYSRYTLLDFNGGMRPFKNRKTNGFMNYLQFIPFYILFPKYGFEAWGGQLGLLHLCILAFVSLVAANHLYCKDLHWRRFLAPNGFRRGRLGTHILRSTLGMCSWFAFALVITYFGVNWLLSDETPQIHLKDLAGMAVLVLELVLAFSIAITLRGTRRPRLALFIYLAVLSVFAIAVVLYLWSLNDLSSLKTWFSIGPGYSIFLIFAIAATMTLANRLWITERLLVFFVDGDDADNERIPAGRWFAWPGKAY